MMDLIAWLNHKGYKIAKNVFLGSKIPDLIAYKKNEILAFEEKKNAEEIQSVIGDSIFAHAFYNFLIWLSMLQAVANTSISLRPALAANLRGLSSSYVKISFSLLISLLLISISSPLVLAQLQSHPLSEIYPMDVNLNLTGRNITNVSYVFFGNNSVDTYAYREAVGVLRIVNSLLVSNWVNASNFNVSNQLCLGGICKNTWPLSLVGGGGTAYYIPIWTASDTLGNSLINQTNGNVWITSGNLNLVSGGLQIAGTSVISSGRNVINVNDVNASRFFQGSNQVIDTLIAGLGISISGSGNSRTISNTGVLSLTAGSGISLNASTGNILVGNTGILGINVNAPLTSSGDQTPTLSLSYNSTAFSLVNNALTLADAYYTGSAYDSRFVNEGQANSITTSMIVDSAITNPKIALNAVNYSQIQQISCPAGQALRVLGGGTYTCVDLSQYGNVTGTGTANYVAKWTGASTLGTSIIQDTGNVTIDTLFVDASNDRVGIGTTAPDAGLHVDRPEKSSIVSSQGIFLSGGSSGNPNIELRGSGKVPYIDFVNDTTSDYDARIILQSDESLRIDMAGTYVQTITRGGNVGIGTTSPQAKLNVIGTFNATSNNGILLLDSDGNIKVGI
jgi:hypothetical protein